MWRKGNTCALLVGMQTGVVSVEESMDFLLKKIKNGTDLKTLSFDTLVSKTVDLIHYIFVNEKLYLTIPSFIKVKYYKYFVFK